MGTQVSVLILINASRVTWDLFVVWSLPKSAVSRQVSVVTCGVSLREWE